ncbi:hypothetical protein LCGC14_2505840, partial [marine sediment metagenome]
TECNQTLIGNHIEQKETWTKLTPADFKKNDILTIGIFTEVQIKDKVEWIPNFFGVRIDEWAGWEASMSVDLVAYYKLDEPSGSIAFDSLGVFNGTNTGVTLNQTGIINRSYLFEGGGNINIGDLNISTNLSLSVWINTSNVNQFGVLVQRSPVNSRWLFFLDTSVINFRGGDATSDITCLIGNITNNTWHNLVAVAESTTGKIYVDGVKCTEGSITAISNAGNTDTLIGRHSSGGEISSLVDEVAIWNRTLTDSEIKDILYNNGIGCTFEDETCQGPSVTLNSPINNFNTINNTIDFNGTVVSPFGITNVSLFIDEILNETNSSGINDTDYLFTKTISDGNHNWTYEACDSRGCSNATTRNFTISDFIEISFVAENFTFETKSETFIINLSTDGTTPTDASLIYNGTDLGSTTLTDTGNDNFNLSQTVDIPIGIGNNSWFFNFSLNGIQSSTSHQQSVAAINLTFCQTAPQNIPYINFTFRNETVNQEDITASITSS